MLCMLTKMQINASHCTEPYLLFIQSIPLIPSCIVVATVWMLLFIPGNKQINKSCCLLSPCPFGLPLGNGSQQSEVTEWTVDTESTKWSTSCPLHHWLQIREKEILIRLQCMLCIFSHILYRHMQKCHLLKTLLLITIVITQQFTYWNAPCMHDSPSIQESINSPAFYMHCGYAWSWDATALHTNHCQIDWGLFSMHLVIRK